MINNFKYTSITYEDIIQEINNRLLRDTRFDNYRESSIVKTLLEIFAGSIDIILYYLQRRAEECYFDTAQLRSSVILLARQLGYVVQRPIPASAKIKIKLKGNFSNKGFVAGTKIQIPYHSLFSYEELNFILKNTITISLTQSMIDDMNLRGPSYESDFITVDYENNDFEIVQGEIKEKVIDGLTNPQINQKFQLYKIEDKEFSNIYGDNDYIPPVTRVWVGNIKTPENEYKIDRRSLVNWQKFSTLNASNNKLCVIRTAVTEDVELIFGDAKYTAIGASISGTGANTISDNIYIQYLATKGYRGNKVGVIGKKLNFLGKIYVENGIGQSFDITDQVEFYFRSNIIGGADLEDIDSIRVNAPSIYYSLDRLVTSKDYVSYLKTLTSPIIIRNAIAWGEQEECIKQNVHAIEKLFNIVFYSCIGEMYDLSQSPYYARTKNNGIDQTVLDNNFDENEIAERNYYNVYTFQEVVRQLKEYNTSSYFYEIIGNSVTATTSYLYLFGVSQDIIVRYASPSFGKVGTKTITVVVNNNLTNIDTYMTNFANRLREELMNINDDREGSITNGLPAFENVSVVYDSLEKNINISIDPSINNCYILSLSALDFSYLSAIGLPSTKNVVINYKSKNVKLSDKIIKMTNILKERSMVTVQNIYISPIIHNFNIKGTVYINPLADKESLKVDISNAIYKWLSINADFNVPIYKSNILDIINGFNDVKYANIYFEPEVLSAINEGYSTFDGTFYNNGNNKYLNILLNSSSYVNWSLTKTTIDSCLNEFLSFGIKDDPKASNLNIQTLGKQTQTYTYNWQAHINERNFFSIFVKNVYDKLLALNIFDITNWVKSEYFMKEMSLIHKDLLKIIRYNMMDTSGNIAVEKDVNGQFVRGGYSLGNEIVKMNVQLVYEYKN